MIKIYVYSLSDGVLHSIESGMANDVIGDLPEGCDFTLTPPPDTERVWRWVNDKWVERKPEQKPIEEQQNTVWEFIKAKRLEQVNGGVLVKSVDKVFQTDNNSLTQYTSIAGMIALDNYEPIEWKTQDNSWVLLTEALFKELQKAVRANTQQAYAIAEQHKNAMLELDNPFGSEYQSGWLNGRVDY